jgi:hypothetical protein
LTTISYLRGGNWQRHVLHPIASKFHAAIIGLVSSTATTMTVNWLRKRILIELAGPVLLSAYPVLFLFANNSTLVVIQDIKWSIILCVGMALILSLITALVLKDGARASLITSLVALLFFSYGHLQNFYQAQNWDDIPYFPLDRHNYALTLWLAILLIGSYVIVRVLPARRIADLVRVTGAVGGLLMTFAIGSILISNLISLNPSGNVGPLEVKRILPPTDVAALENNGGYRFTGELPDIYYIVTDAYSRGDHLVEYFGYDNSDFRQYLTSQGFYVAEESSSNYMLTPLSMASSLNMQYLSTLKPSDRYLQQVAQLIEQSEIRRFLSKYGYQFIYYSSGLHTTTLKQADFELIYWYPGDLSWHVGNLDGSLSHFEFVFGSSTALQPLLDTPAKYENQRQRNIAYLADLSRIPTIEGPTFTLVHVLTPHPPHIHIRDEAPPLEGISVDGAIADPTKAAPFMDLIEHHMFTNRALASAVEAILSGSDTTPIIIIQGDHSQPRRGVVSDFHILNAYLLPHGGSSVLTPDVTPVNSFRIILNYYFGVPFDLLESHSYYAEYEAPYEFTEIPNP